MTAMFDLTTPAPLRLGRRNWHYFLGGLIAVLALLLLADVAISQNAQAWPDPVRTFFFTITDLGDSAWILLPSLILLIVTGLLAALIPKRIARLALIEMTQLYGFIFLGVGLPSLMANLIKRAIGRGRPELYDSVGSLSFQNIVNDWTYQSFPSGHATTIFAFAMVIGFLTPRWFVPMLVVAVLVGLSRIVVGMHYPTDVVGGAVCGILGAYLVRYVFTFRRWLFERQANGLITRRDFAATKRLVASRTGQRPAR